AKSGAGPGAPASSGASRAPQASPVPPAAARRRPLRRGRPTRTPAAASSHPPVSPMGAALLLGDSRPAGRMVDAGERVQSEPFREGAHERLVAFEFDGAAPERLGQGEVS